MREEEKKAIELLKLSIDKNSDLYISDLGDNTIRMAINVIEKQQKEIEVLKKPKYYIQVRENGIAVIKRLDNDFISKAKIREKIKEYESTGYYELEVVLKELLEEN